MVKNSSLADITISLMTLPYLYMRPGHFCQMFMTNGDATLSGKPIRLQAELNNGDHKKLFWIAIGLHLISRCIQKGWKNSTAIS